MEKKEGGTQKGRAGYSTGKYGTAGWGNNNIEGTQKPVLKGGKGSGGGRSIVVCFSVEIVSTVLAITIIYRLKEGADRKAVANLP